MTSGQPRQTRPPPDSLYLYALLARRPTAPIGRGAAREPLRAVRCGKLWAVVGERAPAATSDRAALLAQDACVRRLARRLDALLPARFGSMVASARALEEALAPREPSFLTALERIRGREQMTVRLFGVSATPPKSAASARSGPGTRYLHERLRRHVWSRSAPELDPVRPALAPLVHAERVRRHDAAPLIASVFHLIDRGAAARYRRALARAFAQCPGLEYQVSGPFPPYAFVPEEA